MSADTPPVTTLYEIFYGAKHVDDDELEHDIDQMDATRRAAQIANEEPGRYSMPSIYVLAFEKMLNTVLASEAHLLTDKEFDILDAFSRLSYNARYCLIRLLLRKTNTWYTLASIQTFKREVGEEGLRHAMEALCTPIKSLLAVKEEVDPGVPKESEKEIIDLTLDSDDEDVKPIIDIEISEAGPTRHRDIKPSLDGLLNSSDVTPYEPSFDFFLEDESSMDLSEALHKLSVDQLRDLVRETKTTPDKSTKPCMISALLEYASTQKPLGFLATSKAPRKTKCTNDGLSQTTLPFPKIRGKSSQENQQRRLLQMALEKLGKTYRVNFDLYCLIARINVIYDRCTEYPKSLLVPSLLTSFKKRTYPQYNYTRDSTIWETREEFLDYFEALKLEAAIETELEPSPPGRPRTKTPTPFHGTRNKFVTPAPPTPGRSLSTPLRTPMSTASAKLFTESPAVPKKEEDLPFAVGIRDGEGAAEEPIKIQAARRVKKLFDEAMLPKWRELVVYKQERDIRERTPGLERFEPGFVYTRMLSKVMRALATLRLYREEAAVLEALLDQPFWRRGKRAKWYERRAILQTRYLCKDEDPEVKKKDIAVLRQALEGVHAALKDGDTGLVWRPGLVRRLRKLEKELKVPEEERCFCEGELRTANIVEFAAKRLLKTSTSLKLDATGRPISEGNGSNIRSYFSPLAANPAIKGGTAADKENRPTNPSDNWKWKGKSIWRGVNGEELNVESRALQYYESLGYKGFHSETRILTTIFALLFWDIIFSDVPGAFETPHQTAPLDMAEDSFYRARKGSIDARLEEIREKGRAREIVKRHDDLYREKKVWCVGVRWDICEQQDLLEIVECLGGNPLSIICRLFCEDYAGRSSGVPDLIVWNAAEGVCKFVEVKGPGDNLSENQKLWLDSLLGAGADVEICRVLDKDKPIPTKSAKAKKTGTWSSTTKKSKGKGKGKARVGDSDVEMDCDSPDPANLPDDEAWGASPILGKRRRRPPDENDDQLPTFHSSATPPMSPAVPLARRASLVEVVLPSPKKRKLASVPPS
ncbi:putative VRR_NUC [Lyophyllum shimeji]|uniref:Fanconi-associated nuclease n=1 Tax=Lyophyllum shimeji TaxID=47721 RepID=A0A9P3PFT4_LYOSH|nr:putative VRR_NUC [Lyophyllum shimeji]